MKSRPVPLHREKHPKLDVEGCFGCKATGVRFGTVPGGSQDEATGIAYGRRVEKGLHRYRDLKQAGEQPSGTTLEAQAKDSYKKKLWEKHEASISIENDAETITQVKKSLLNKG